MRCSTFGSLASLATLVTLSTLPIFAAQGCAAAATDGTDESSASVSSSADLVDAVPVYRRDDPNEGLKLAAPAGLTSPGSVHLEYFGGRVLANVKVYAVSWGSNVTPEVQTRIGDFYKAVTDSAYFDWLSEYDTTVVGLSGQPGTNQHIGRGSFGGQFTITPSVTTNAITNADVASELVRQLDTGALPAPDDNAVYMFDFPPGVTIRLGNAVSCRQFCGYHNTVAYQGKQVSYGVVPDMSRGSGCDLGCGNDPSMFNNTSAVHSHELIEAVTDPDVNVSHAWLDRRHGEIGDPCHAQHANVAGYIVQKEWSNAKGACIATVTP